LFVSWSDALKAEEKLVRFHLTIHRINRWSQQGHAYFAVMLAKQIHKSSTTFFASLMKELDFDPD